MLQEVLFGKIFNKAEVGNLRNNDAWWELMGGIVKMFTRVMKRRIHLRWALLILSIVAITAATGATLYAKPLQNQETESTPSAGSEVFFAAAISMVGSAIGAGIAIYGAATAGFAAAAERPELRIWILIVSGLGEGLAIYGLVVAVMILGKI